MPEIHFRDVEDRQLFFPELNNTKNPDIRLNGMLGDFKIPDRKIVNRDVAARCITTNTVKEVPICIISLLHNELYSTRYFERHQRRINNSGTQQRHKRSVDNFPG
jgi:hypothetical protein